MKVNNTFLDTSIVVSFLYKLITELSITTRSIDLLKSSTKDELITVGFSFRKINAKSGVKIKFFNNSEGKILVEKWSFPGGIPNASYERNPEVVYNLDGQYLVTLRVKYNNSTKHQIKSQMISVINSKRYSFDSKYIKHPF